MKKSIISSFIALIAIFSMSGCGAMKMGMTYMGFEPKTQKTYADMMAVVDKTGDPAEAISLEWQVLDPDLSEQDIFDEMKDLAGEYNMRFVGEKDMFRLKAIENPTPEKVVHARIAEFCSLSIAKRMLNHSRFYGAMMPCRIIFVEYGDGRKYLITMNMALAIYGGTNKKPIDPELFEQMQAVEVAMNSIGLNAIGYDTQEDYEKDLAAYKKSK